MSLSDEIFDLDINVGDIWIEPTHSYVQ